MYYKNGSCVPKSNSIIICGGKSEEQESAKENETEWGRDTLDNGKPGKDKIEFLCGA